jgi:hypothetical protein
MPMDAGPRRIRGPVVEAVLAGAPYVAALLVHASLLAGASLLPEVPWGGGGGAGGGGAVVLH